MSTTVAGAASGQSWQLMQMQGQLQKAVNNGSVKAGDQDALSAALTDISSQLQANAAGSTGTPAPGGVKSAIDGIIASDVSSGKLTSDQADELKSTFAQAAQKMHGHGGHHHGHGGGGDVSGTDPDSDDGTDIDPITGLPTTSSSPTSFVDFLQQLETSLTSAVDGVTGTSATGSTASGSTATDATGSSTGGTLAANDPRQMMLNFLQKLETAMSGNTYSAAGANATGNTQAVLVNAFA